MQLIVGFVIYEPTKYTNNSFLQDLLDCTDAFATRKSAMFENQMFVMYVEKATPQYSLST